MQLSNLIRIKGIKGKKKRLGRGIGSGKGGHTVGRGTKGQKARRGAKPNLGFEGGQTPLYKRLPQIGGFRSRTSKEIEAVKMGRLNVFKENTEVTPQTLLEKGIIKSMPKDGVKILLGGKLEKKFVLKGFHYSKSARQKILKSGTKIND